MSERLTASPSGRCVTEGPMLVAPREVLCCVLPWSFPARVSCPWLRFVGISDPIPDVGGSRGDARALRSCSARLRLRRAAWRAHSLMWRAAWCLRR